MQPVKLNTPLPFLFQGGMEVHLSVCGALKVFGYIEMQ